MGINTILMEREGLLVYKLYIIYVEWLVLWEMALGGSCPSSPLGAPRTHIGL